MYLQLASTDGLNWKEKAQAPETILWMLVRKARSESYERKRFDLVVDAANRPVALFKNGLPVQSSAPFVPDAG